MANPVQQMVPIPITEFIAGSTNPVDLYVKIGEDKFILIAKQNGKTQKDQLKTYENKDVHYL